MRRIQREHILKDLGRKMVFLSGPRQVGKSWLAQDIATEFARPVYLNYDNPQDRDIFLRQAWASDTDLLILDEIHKMEGWKGFLKGVYDTKPASLSILVTGSARLETFRQSGESLAGRYFHHRLLPLAPGEAAAAGEPRSLAHFLSRGGFPEPFLAESEAEAGRWRRSYLDGLVREDILSFENIRELKAMNLLVSLLRERVASPLSYQALSEDIGTSINTVKRYLDILEALYIVFRVYPHHRSIARAIVQQPKLYFYDSGLVGGSGGPGSSAGRGSGPGLENHVAVALLKELALREDADGIPRSLRYLRTKEGRETDFLIAVDDQPRLAVEVKASEASTDPGLSYFCGKYGLPGLQLVGDLRLERDEGAPGTGSGGNAAGTEGAGNGIRVRRAQGWLERIGEESL